MGTPADTISEYELSAIEHGEATEDGDATRANAAYDRLMTAFRELLRVGDREMLLPLLVHEGASVRCWAGVHCLPIDEARAKRALQEVAAGTGMVALTAGTVLSEWENGSLTDPELT